MPTNAAIKTATDATKLKTNLAKMEENAAQVPAEMNPILDVVKKKVQARIAELGITLPEPAKPVASYVSFVRSGNQITISGQLSNDANGGIKGTVGVDVTPEQAVVAARLCGINLIAQIKAGASFEELANRRSHRWYRVFNEVSVLLFATITCLVVLKPSLG